MVFKSILLAIDGSEHASRAAHLAGELARQMGSNLRVVTAFAPIPSFLGEPDRQRVISAHMRDTDSALEDALQQIGEIPGEIKTEIIEGPAAEAILKIAKVRQVELIIMGTRGLGRLTGLLLGSQSQKVVSLAPCPVLLVK